MAMTASDLIDEARDYHERFHPELVSEQSMLRRLTSAQRDLYSAITKVSEEALATPAEILQAAILTALGNRAGITVPEHSRLLDSMTATLTDETHLARVDMVSYANLDNLDYFPAVCPSGSKIFPVDLRDYGNTLHGWETVSKINYFYVATPGVLAASTTLLLPDDAHSALVLELVLFAAGKTGAIKDLPQIPQQYLDVRAAAIDTIASRPLAARSRVIQR